MANTKEQQHIIDTAVSLFERGTPATPQLLKVEAVAGS
jgi:hypothetical protein